LKLEHVKHHLARVRPWHGVVVVIALIAVVGMVSLAIGGLHAPRASPQGFVRRT
jgi:hypothetical protein